MSRWLIIGALMAFLPACREEVMTSAAPSVRDSAGVRIVEYAGIPTSVETFELAPEPIYRLGDDPDEYLFQMVSAGILRDDGSAVLADHGKNQVIAIGIRGNVEKVVASEGAGPGEVRGVQSLHWLEGDSLIVEDDWNARFITFDSDGYAETVPVTGGLTQVLLAQVHGVAENGDLLMGTSGFTPGENVGWQDGHMMRFDRRTGVTDTIATFAYIAPGTDGTRNMFAPSGAMTVSGRGFVVGRGDLPEVRWLTSGGALRQVVRWDPEVRSATREDVALFTERYRESLVRADLTQLVEEFDRTARENANANIGRPLPLFSTLVSDGDGGILVGDYVIGGGEPTRFDLIASDGSWRGSLQVPSKVRILDVRNGRILAVLSDELDVQSVAVFELLSAPLRESD